MGVESTQGSCCRLKEGRDTSILCYPSPRRGPWHRQGQASGKDLLLLLPSGRSLVCLVFLLTFAPRRDPQVRGAFSQAQRVGWATYFLLTTHLQSLVLPLSGFASHCAGPRLWNHHPQSCNIRAQGFSTSFPLSPIQLLGAQPLALSLAAVESAGHSVVILPLLLCISCQEEMI